MAGIGKRRFYEEEVKRDYSIKLTPTAAKLLSEKAEKLSTSRSQLVEMFARGEISPDLYQEMLGKWSAS